jgi:tetratricopeptide (TPR) repeat protein
VDLQKRLNSAAESAELGDYELAAREYESALEALLINCEGLAPQEHAKAIRSIAFNLAQVLNKLSSYQEALKHVDLGLTHAPTAFGKAIAFAAKGEALYGLERPIEGKQMFEEAVRAHPITGRLNSADSMVRLGLPELVSLADDWVNTVATVFDGQLNDSQRAEVELIRHQIATKRSISQSSSDLEAAKSLADQAIKLARVPGQLAAASRLMEAAVSKCPAIRAEYEYRLQLWQRGVAM